MRQQHGLHTRADKRPVQRLNSPVAAPIRPLRMTADEGADVLGGEGRVGRVEGGVDLLTKAKSSGRSTVQRTSPRRIGAGLAGDPVAVRMVPDAPCDVLVLLGGRGARGGGAAQGVGAVSPPRPGPSGTLRSRAVAGVVGAGLQVEARWGVDQLRVGQRAVGGQAHDVVGRIGVQGAEEAAPAHRRAGPGTPANQQRPAAASGSSLAAELVATTRRSIRAARDAARSGERSWAAPCSGSSTLPGRRVELIRAWRMARIEGGNSCGERAVRPSGVRRG